MIELKEVWKSYGRNVVLRGLSLKVGKGEFVAIRGKSGAGKSTLLKIIGLLEDPDRGEVRILGRDPSRLSDPERARFRLHKIGFVFQFFNLIPTLTVLENIELPMALAGVRKGERRRRALELLKEFGLEGLANRFPETLSGGERQRVAILRALANRPELVLADEPTSSLDDENTELVIKMLLRLNREERVTVIMTTTDLSESIPCDKDYMLRNGRLELIS